MTTRVAGLMTVRAHGQSAHARSVKASWFRDARFLQQAKLEVAAHDPFHAERLAFAIIRRARWARFEQDCRFYAGR